jgi:hypothetical protein
MAVTTVESIERRAVDRGVRITVARTQDEAQALRPWFERVRPLNPDADLDFFLTVSQMVGARPYVALCELPDDRAILVVGRLEEGSSRIPGRRGVRTLRLAFSGVIGARTATDCQLVVEVLRRALAAGEADTVVLPQLDTAGALYAAARMGVPWWRADHTPTPHVHWRAHVPDSLDAFLEARSSNTRYHVRRYAKRLLRDHGQDLTVREFGSAADLDQLCADLESVAAKTYQRGLGVGYSGDSLQHALLELCASRDWLRAWVLYLSGMPVAFWYGYRYAETFWLVGTGFDPDHAELRVGQYLQMQMMDGLCRDPDVHGYDYGAGEAEYKRRFGDSSAAEADVVLYAPSLRAIRINIARTIRLSTARRIKTWIARTKLGAQAKKAWRKRAERRAQSRTT